MTTFAPALGAQAQPAGLPAFELTSVKPDTFIPVPGNGRVLKVTCSNGRFFSQHASVWYLIKWAWNIVGDNDRLAGDYPDWAGSGGDFYVIDAKAAAPVSENECRLMVRGLLADRFHLRTHEEKRTIDAFDLVVAQGGPKITRVTDPNAPVNGPGFTISGQTMQMLDASAKGWTMDQLAYILRTAQLEHKVFDRTGLEGIYRINLSFRRRGDESGEGADVTTALREQLGLELRSAKEPIDVVVVDHVERPTPN